MDKHYGDLALIRLMRASHPKTLKHSWHDVSRAAAAIKGRRGAQFSPRHKDLTELCGPLPQCSFHCLWSSRQWKALSALLLTLLTTVLPALVSMGKLLALAAPLTPGPTGRLTCSCGGCSNVNGKAAGFGSPIDTVAPTTAAPSNGDRKCLLFCFIAS